MLFILKRYRVVNNKTASFFFSQKYTLWLQQEEVCLLHDINDMLMIVFTLVNVVVFVSTVLAFRDRVVYN